MKVRKKLWLPRCIRLEIHLKTPLAGKNQRETFIDETFITRQSDTKGKLVYTEVEAWVSVKLDFTSVTRVCKYILPSIYKRWLQKDFTVSDHCPPGCNRPTGATIVRRINHRWSRIDRSSIVTSLLPASLYKNLFLKLEVRPSTSTSEIRSGTPRRESSFKNEPREQSKYTYTALIFPRTP